MVSDDVRTVEDLLNFIKENEIPLDAEVFCRDLDEIGFEGSVQFRYYPKVHWPLHEDDSPKLVVEK